MNTKIPVYLFVLLALFVFPYTSLFGGLNIPGWNTSNHSTNFIALFLFAVILCVSYQYVKLRKHHKKVKSIVVISQFLLSVPFVICANYLYLISDLNVNPTPEQVFKEIDFISKFAFSSILLFIIGQIIFLYYRRKLLRNKGSG